MTDLKRATELLTKQGHTCVLCRGEEVRVTDLRGVRPLVTWLESGADLQGFSAADKVVGKATACLYVLLGVRAVWAQVMSRSALTVLENHGIAAQYGELAEHIINRAGNGICPFEAEVLDIHTPEEARTAILRKMSEMGIPLNIDTICPV